MPRPTSMAPVARMTSGMSGLTVDPVVIPGHEAERVDYPAATIWLRAAGHGDVQVADYTSTDRDGPSAHSPPYDAFARDMARLFAAGAPLTEIVDAAGWHGVTLG